LLEFGLLRVEFAVVELLRAKLPGKLFDELASFGSIVSGSLFSSVLAFFQKSSLDKASAILSSTFLVSVPGEKKTDLSGPSMPVESDSLDDAADDKRAVAVTIINKTTITLFIIPTIIAVFISQVDNTISTFPYPFLFSPYG